MHIQNNKGWICYLYNHVYRLLKLRHLWLHLHIHTRVNLQGENRVQFIGCLYASCFLTWKKGETSTRQKELCLLILCSERRSFREKNIMKKRSCQVFFFLNFLLLNYFDCVAPGRCFPLPLLPGSSSPFVKSFRCKKVNLLLLLIIFFLFNEQLQTPPA